MAAMSMKEFEEEEELAPVTYDDEKPFDPTEDEMDDEEEDSGYSSDDDDSSTVRVHHRDEVDDEDSPTTAVVNHAGLDSSKDSTSSNEDEEDEALKNLADLVARSDVGKTNSSVAVSSQVTPKQVTSKVVSVASTENVTGVNQNSASCQAVSSGAFHDSSLESAVSSEKPESIPYIPLSILMQSQGASALSSQKGGISMASISDTSKQTVISDVPNSDSEFSLSSRKKPDEVVKLEDELRSLDGQITDHKNNVDNYAALYQAALPSDAVLASNYNSKKLEEERTVSELSSQYQKIKEDISQALEKDDVRFYCGESARLYDMVSSISNCSVNVDFKNIDSFISLVSSHLTALLASTDQKVSDFYKLYNYASDDIAKTRFKGVLDFYKKQLEVLTKYSNQIVEVRQIFDSKYQAYAKEIKSSKELAVMLSQMPNNLMYSLFSNLGNQIYVLQHTVNSLHTQLEEYKQSNEALKKQVELFSEELQTVPVHIDTDAAQSLVEPLSTALQVQIQKSTDDLSSSVADSVSQKMESVMSDLNTTSANVAEAARATDTIRKANEMIGQVMGKKEDMDKVVTESFENVSTSLAKSLETKLGSVVNSKVELLRKDLYAAGCDVFTGFCKSYGIVGSNRPWIYYATSPLCILTLINVLLGLFIFIELCFFK